MSLIIFLGLGFSIIICYEKKMFFEEKNKSLFILLKKTFENIIFKISQVIFNEYQNLMN